MATAKQPGGYYLSADKKSAHDAEGKPVPLIKAGGANNAAKDIELSEDLQAAEAEIQELTKQLRQKDADLAAVQAEKDQIVADALSGAKELTAPKELTEPKETAPKNKWPEKQADKPKK